MSRRPGGYDREHPVANCAAKPVDAWLTASLASSRWLLHSTEVPRSDVSHTNCEQQERAPLVANVETIGTAKVAWLVYKHHHLVHSANQTAMQRIRSVFFHELGAKQRHPEAGVTKSQSSHGHKMKLEDCGFCFATVWMQYQSKVILIISIFYLPQNNTDTP